MIKMSTLYKKNPEDLSMVINELNQENKWVLDGEAVATRKFDGSACMIISGELYKRYDLKKGRIAPPSAIPCQEADLITGHHPHWVKCQENNPADKYFLEAFTNLQNKADGTYELCGEKVQGNPEHVIGNKLIKHGSEILNIADLSFNGLKQYLSNPELDIEGIVFHHKTDGRMCKIRKKDFGFERKMAKI